MSVVTLPTLTIPSGSTESNAIGRKWLDLLDSLTIHAPASLAGSVNVEVSDEDPDEVDSPTWRNLELPDGTAITLTADEATPIPEISFAGLRLVEGTGPGSDETFPVTGSDGGFG